MSERINKDKNPFAELTCEDCKNECKGKDNPDGCKQFTIRK